jgi:hypothetical protein
VQLAGIFGDIVSTPIKIKMYLIFRKSGLSRLAGGNILCVTEDYFLNEIDLTIKTEGVFKGLEVTQVTTPSNPVMLCRGIATSWSGDCSTLFVLERYI